MATERPSFMERVRVRARANTPGPVSSFKVYQGGRLVGYLPGLPRRSKSRLYDIRPGDFRFDDLGDGTVIVAHNSLGPGDFTCLEGFAPLDDELRDAVVAGMA